MATNGGNIVVPVGVQLELQNVQEIIANLQKAMSNVKLDTKGYSSIVSELSKAEKRADGLAAKLKQGFTTQAGLQNFTKGFEELIAMVDVVNNKVGQINFDNLSLTPEQQAQMADFAKQIEAAKNAYNALETSKIQQAVNASQQLQQVFQNLKIDIKTTSLDNAIATIKSRLAEVQKIIDENEKKVNQKTALAGKHQQKMDEIRQVQSLFDPKTDLKQFSNIFDRLGRFKAGGRDELANWMQRLGFDKDTIESVKKQAGTALAQLKDDIDKKANALWNKSNIARGNALKDRDQFQVNVDQAKQEKIELDASEASMTSIQNSQDIVNGKQQEKDAIQLVTQALKQYTDAILKSVKGDFAGNADTLSQALNRVRDSGGSAAAVLENLNQRAKTVDSIKRSVSMWMGFNQVLRLTRTAIKNIIKDIRDLDKVMTEIAVVTNMSQKDLWNQMNTYQDIAKQYGVATTGVYQVSQIYYQQGLQTSEVMNLTNETLKMAKIAGLDYSKAADYMTVAIRGFKMEMSDAQNVVDVYSNLAAKSASDTTELATAMSKTASSAAAVGSSFENTSAMIAMMVETTRESAENIGSALKSIISRYGEMTSDPSKLIDSEGEALSLNKVDKALQSIGISLHDTQGQFRDFDDVILELSSKWDTLDKNSQRYIATIMAGNRQQSRFLALVSDYDRLSELTEIAANSEDAALVQTLKTMDSLETKIQNVKNAFQGFYANLGLEEVFKGVLDVITSVINQLNTMPKAFGKIPIAAIGMVANIVNIIKTLGTTLITVSAAQWSRIRKIIETSIAGGTEDGVQQAEQKMERLTPKQKKQGVGWAIGSASSLVGAGLSTWALTMKDSEAPARGLMQSIGGLASGFGSLATSIAMIPGPAGIVLGLISAATSAMPGLIAGINDLQHAQELQISAARKAAEEANQEATLAKSEAKNLENVIKKLEKLSKAKNESNEAYQEWLDYVNQVANDYPQLISFYNAENNAVLDMAEAYSLLAESRAEASKKAKEARKAELDSKQLERDYVNNIFDRMNDPKYVYKIGDAWGSGLRNLYGNVRNGSKGIQLNLQSLFGSKWTGDLSDYLETQTDDYNGDTVKLKIDALDNFLQNYADNKFKELPDDLTAMLDIFYDSLIKPLSSMDFAEGTRYDDDYLKKELDYIEKTSFNSEVEKQQAIAKVYVTALQDIQKYVRQNTEDEAELARINEELAINEEDFIIALAERIQEAKENKVANEEISKLTDVQNSKLLQALYNDLQQRGIITDKNKEEYLDSLINFYTSMGEESQKAVTEILANSEKYSSKDSLIQKLGKYIDFSKLDGQLKTSIVNYINDFWEKTNKNLQDSFKTNIKDSQKRNDTIQKASQKLSFIGDGVTEFDGEKYPEIAAQYLNDINKQWSDLVTNQKNEAVATQNAKFLADTYTNVGQLSEDANGAMANILSTAELNTREGIQKAIDQIEQYQDTNDLKDEDKGKIVEIIKELQVHKDNLLLNLNTELQQYIDSLSDAVKNVNQNYANNTSGFNELKDVNETLQKINSGKIGSKQLTFDEAFKFDENLGKYIFTVQGLMEANEAQMKEINSQYKDATEQLDWEKVFLTNVANTLKGFSTEDIIKGLTNASTKEGSKLSSEQQQIIGQIAKDFENSDLEWDEFIENRSEELKKLDISAEQAKKAAENMTKEAQARNAAKAIDFSGISIGTKKVSEARQELINYFITSIDNWEELTEAQKEEYEKQAEFFADETYQKISGGGRTAAEEYRKIAEEQNIFDPDTYNQILNQPGQAAKSLLDKLNNSIGQTSIQLTQEEVTLANELGIKNDGVSVIAGELRANAGKLIDSLSENLAQGNITLQEYNKQVAENNKTSGEKLTAKADALTTFLTSGAITVDSLSTLATSLGTKLKEDFSITELKGIKKNENGVDIVEDLDAFLESFNNIITSSIDVEAIKNALDLQDKSKITDAAVQAENSIIESIASEINNIKSAGIGKKVNLTYLTNKLGADNLRSIFGNAYQNGILTVTDAVKANMYDSLKEVRTSLKASRENTDELTAALMSYIDSAISDFSNFSGAFDVSDETAQLLASRTSIFEAQLIANGKIAIDSIESFVTAANVIYNEVNEQYAQGLANLTKLNNAYSNIIKGNLAKQTAGFNMLTSASKIDLSSLQNFLNTYNEKLSKYVDRMGKLTSTGAEAGLKSLGNGNYQIADWHKFISQLQITANELSADYIDAYISWLQSDANVAPDAKEALMTSLVPNMEKLTYAQIGQIAKTFNMTVDQVLALVENNGDNTFNGSALLNTLDFDKHNQEFKQALTKQYSEITNNLTSALVSFVESGSDGKRTGLDFANLDKAVNDYTKAMRSLSKDVEIDLYNLKMRLVLGGESAVAAGQEIAKFGGVELSAQDIETLYRGAITRYVNTIDTVVAKPGEIVDEATASIIKQAGGKVNELGTTGQYVVETAANLYEAYNDLLHRMAATGEATLADLNKVAALALENRDGEQQVIDALGDAAGMTFTRFGEILANAGIQLTEDMVNNLETARIIELMGGNKMKIVDFQAFADLMQWDANSEEYVSAFKSYNDSLIEMNRQAERNILEEAESIADAKGGDWINLTQLYNKIFEPLKQQVEFTKPSGAVITAFDRVNQSLSKYGGFIEDGILKLEPSANIPAIMQEIARAAAESGGLLSNELAELADAVADTIKGYADLISGAISGSLPNVQAEQLQDWATANGIGDLNFTQTADGLKVAKEQAFELVNALKQVDSMQGKLTFDNLVNSLSADKGGRFENISKTTAEIAKAQREIYENNQKIDFLQKDDEKTNAKDIQILNEKNAKLREQIGLYREIQQRQSIDPSQYNFMDRELPEVMQGPINYWNSIGQAFSAMNEAGQTGRMAINDFYNIVTEMENLANTSGQAFNLAGYQIGGEASQAAQLIQNGLSHLTNIDGKGVKVNLAKLGIDFASGADEAKSGFTEGIHSLAQSQIDMLDAAIQVLEVVVAMEELGNIDVDNNGIFSIGDIFGEQVTVGNGEKIDAYTTEFQDYAKKILKAAETNEDLRKGLENFSVNGVSLKEMFEDATDRLKDLDISKEAYFAIMNSFVEAAKNGDYNLDTIQDSVWQILEQTLPDGSVIDIGTRSIVISGGTKTIIDWEDPNVQAVIDDIGGEEEEARNKLLESFQKWQNGTSEQVDMERVLKAQGKLKVENGKITYNGKEYLSMTDAMPDIAKDVLREMGAEGPFDEYEDEGGNLVVTSSLTVGKHTIQVKFTNGKRSYVDPETGEEAGSLKELVDKIITRKTNEFEQSLHGNATPQQIKEYREKLQAQLYFEYEISGTDTNLNGTDEEIRQLLEKSNEEIQAAIDAAVLGKDGKFHAKFDDSDIDIEFSDKDLNADAVKQKAIEHFQNSGITAAIGEGVKSAFKGDTTIQDAISEAIRSALGINTGSNTGESGEGSQNSISIPEVTLAPTGLKIDLSSAGEPTLSSGEGESQDIQISEITLKPETINVDTTSFDAKPVAQEIAEAIQTALKEISITPNVEAGSSEIDGPTVGGIDTSSITNGFTDAINAVTSKIKDISKEAGKITADNVKEITKAENEIGHQHVTEIGAAEASISSSHISAVRDAANAIQSQPAIDAKNAINQIAPPPSITTTFRANLSKAKGTIGNNAALAGGQNTLMGELGPELVVSHGRYFLVGQNGAEFVNLDKDAIVFNHLQTRKLMEQGSIGSYGRPITNDRNAVSMAGGSNSKRQKNLDIVSNVPPNPPPGAQQPQTVAGVAMNPIWWNLDLKNKRQLSSGGNAHISFAKGTGPAMASASAALEALKRLRAMWQSLLGAGLDDLGALGGSGGGGGGGGGGKTADEIKSILDKVEKWYNLLQKIEGTQRKINILQKEYSLIGEGQASTQQRIDNLQEQYAQRQKSIQDRTKLIAGYEEDLAEERAKIEDKKSGYSAFFDFDEDGNLQLAGKDNFGEWVKKHGATRAIRRGDSESLEVSKSLALTTQKEVNDKNELNKRINEKETITAKTYNKLTEEEQANFEEVRDEKTNKVTGYKRKGTLKTDYKIGDLSGERKKDTVDVPETGLELMNLLQTKDNYGNNIYDSEAQFDILKQLGFEDMIGTLEDGTKLDLSTAEGRAKAVENFIAKINGERDAYEQLTQQIQEQTEAKLDDEIAVQEINEQIKELATPVAGVTEGLDKWHNRLREITKLQTELNKLTGENNLLQKDGIANGEETYQNLQNQLDNLEKQARKNANLAKARRDEAKKIYDNSGMGSFLQRDSKTGAVSYKAFDEAFLSQIKVPIRDETGDIPNKGKDKHSIAKTPSQGLTKSAPEAVIIRYTKSKDLVRNEEGYLTDTEGKYIDKKGRLHSADGNIITDTESRFGQLAVKENAENGGAFTVTKGENMADVLERLTAQDANGKTMYSAEEQFQILTAMGWGDLMQYDENGNRIYDDLASITPEQMKTAVQNGITRLQSTVDDINEQVDAADQLDQENLELRAQAQEIVQSIIDNQMELENKVLQAVEDLRQTEIDNAQKERDAYAEATSNLIDGLSSQLQNERDMYSHQEDKDEVARLQRQIAILQRSGGSGSQIQSLQSQLASKQQDMYFDERQAQIDKIKEASDAQLEKMDHQIEIMTETLQYEKENGLLWAKVAEEMNGTPSEIAAFISQNTKDYASYSALALQQQQSHDLEMAQTYSASVADGFNAVTALNDTYQRLLEAATGVSSEKEAGPEDNNEGSGDQGDDKGDEPNSNTEVKDAITAGLGEEGAIAKAIAAAEAQRKADAAAEAAARETEKTEREAQETQRKAEEATKEEQRKTEEATKEAQRKTEEATKKAEHKAEIAEQTKGAKDRHAETKKKIGGVKKAVKSNKEAVESSSKIIKASKESIIATLNKQRTLKGSISTSDSSTKKKGATDFSSMSISLTQYKTGGLNTKPGLAWLDGTKSKPEYVLNPEQTAMLRESLFMSGAVSRMLTSASALPSSVSSIYDSMQEESIEIGTLNVNVNVPSVASDYDSRRIGEIAMEEMMQIARKHGARGLSRR